MLLPRIVMLSLAMTVLGTGATLCQSYPNKTVRIVTTETGGSSDFASRLIAQGLTGSLGQPVIVDNRAGGVIPGEIVSKAPPDGYTLLLASSSLWIGPLMRKTPYDAVRDFLPITLGKVIKDAGIREE